MRRKNRWQAREILKKESNRQGNLDATHPQARKAIESAKEEVEDDWETEILRERFAYLKDFVPVEGCRVCNHEIINCRNHTHCSTLGMELICDCPTCKGTGKEVK